jgi:multimeric flavodoxin WrbA
MWKVVAECAAAAEFADEGEEGGNMRAVVLNGARTTNEPSNTAFDLVVEDLKSRGSEPVPIVLRDKVIGSCRGCFGCWVKTPGACLINDDAQDIAKEVMKSRLVIFITPVTFGGYSSELKKAADRLVPILSPFFTKVAGEIHHKKRYGLYPRLAAVGVLAHPDEESERLFRALIKRNATNMHSPEHEVAIITAEQSRGAMESTIDNLLDKLGA